MVNAIEVMLAAAIAFRGGAARRGRAEGRQSGEYLDGVIRCGCLRDAFWGVVGFLVGVCHRLATGLSVAELRIPAGLGNFGRLRPLHTSAVIFAFGGNALIMSAFYVVQRTSAARLWGGNLAWFVFWGWQLVIVLAATGYVLGGTQGKEYAEPAWYVDILITVVWVPSWRSMPAR
jgi:cytochrome c oxidase cbb3-type subunit 1